MGHEAIEIRAADGICPSHLFTPAGAGPWPAVILFMDGIGIRPAMFAVGERIAAAGYYVLLPDLFYRAGAYTSPDPKKLFSDETVRAEWWKKLFAHVSVEKIMRDLPAFFAQIDGDSRARGPKLGATGYCMGARMALAAAGHFPDRFAAVAGFHPGNPANDAPDSPHLLASKMKARILVAGASEDPSFPDEQKRRLEESLTAAGVTHTIETWPARHGWVPSDTPVHDAAQAERHYSALLDLFTQTLK
jgi:carboxymethylenebutenolidase